MSKGLQSLFIGAALAMTLAGCQRGDGLPITSNDATRDPSVPDAATVFAAQDAADKTKAMQDTATLQRDAVSKAAMTDTEESKAMPLPGQANDHSTTPEKAKGG